jgi:two-component system, NarL family, nitrate/nitrite response regulator NarL
MRTVADRGRAAPRMVTQDRPCQAATALIVDDHKLFAEAIGTSLGRHGLNVIGIAEDEEDALQQALRYRPDVILMDLGLPGAGGASVGARILAALPDTKVVAVTALHDPGAVTEVIRAGFRGYLTKDSTIDRLVASIRAILSGEVVISGRLARAATGGRSEDERDALFRAQHLTAREREVLQLLAEGASSEQVADKLSVSSHTVRTHVQNTLAKLQVHSRLEAATFAVRYGIAEVNGARRNA